MTYNIKYKTVCQCQHIKFRSLILVTVGEEEVFSFVFRNVLNKKQYSILYIRDLFDNNVLHFLTETIENFIIGTHVSYIFRINPMFGINFLTDI